MTSDLQAALPVSISNSKPVDSLAWLQTAGWRLTGQTGQGETETGLGAGLNVAAKRRPASP